MAIPDDVNFGSDFSQSEFEAAITSVMQMAAPEDVAMQATFRWKSSKTFDRPDRSGRPLSLDDAPSATSSTPDMVVDCLVTFRSGVSDSSEFTNMTEFIRPRATIQLLDGEYQKIKDADEVLLGGNLYEIKFTQPPEGLFGVTNWYMQCQAVDES